MSDRRGLVAVRGSDREHARRQALEALRRDELVRLAMQEHVRELLRLELLERTAPPD